MKNKKKVNYKVLTIIIVVAVVITTVLSFLFIKNKNGIIKTSEKEGELLQASYTGTMTKTINNTNTSINYVVNEYYNSSEDYDYPYWEYYSMKIGNKKFNYIWLAGKCYKNNNYSSYCTGRINDYFYFYSFYSNGNKYVAVVSTPIKVRNYHSNYSSSYNSVVSIPPYTATVFLETDSEYQMVFEVPTPRYVQFDLSTTTYGSYSSNCNFAINISSGYLQYLAMSTTSGKVDVHQVTFNGNNATDRVVGQEIGSIKMG